MKRHKILATLLFLVIGALSGCSNNEKLDLERINTDDLATASNPVIPPIVFGESSNSEGSNSKNEYESISGQNNNNSSTETEFEISEAGNYYSAVSEIFEYDPDKVKSILLGNINVTDNMLTFPDRSPLLNWKYEDKELYISNDDAVLEYTSNLSVSINIIFTPPTLNYSGNADLFEHNGDNLDFCTRDEAVKSVSNILSELGVSVSEKADVYALCQSDMQIVVDEECAKGTFYQFDSEWQRVPVASYTVQKDQECYYIVFHADYGGVPIYNDALYYMTIKDLAIFHPTITAIYSADGLVGLNVNEYRTVVQQGEKISEIISPAAAAQVVGEKYKDVVGIDKISFDKMSLMYVLTPISENGKINLHKTNMIPAWVCTVKKTEYTYDRETGTEIPKTSQKNVLIDAQTGLEII